VAASAPGVVALPGAVPVSPSAPTASAATKLAGQKAAPRPPQARAGYQFKWWHGLIAAGLLLACGMVALGALNRARNQTTPPATKAAPTQAATQPPATQAPAPTPATTGAPSQPGWRPIAEQAAALYQTGQPEEALAQLEAMVQANPRDPGAYLVAGNLTLANNRPAEAVNKFFLPGLALNPEGREPVFVQMREQAALALYVAAADPGTEQFLLDLGTNGELKDSSANLAFQRWRLFHGDAETARIEIESIVQGDRLAAGPQLVYGDYFLKVGRPAEAVIHYEIASRNPPGARAPIAWVALEARCRQQKLRDRSIDLTATCEPLSTLALATREP
jgi:tetratricopeptide (TPR) repeat protein